MVDKPTRLLYVDDAELDRELVRLALQDAPRAYELVEADSRDDFVGKLSQDFSLVITDLNILGYSGLDVLQLVKREMPEVPVVILTGTGTEELAVQAMKMGASDYVIKSVRHMRRLPLTIDAVLQNEQLRRSQREVQQRLAEVVETNWDGPHGYMRLSQPFPTPWGPVEGHIDTDSHGPGFSVTWFRGLIDTGLMGCNIPIDEESTEIRFTFVCRRAEGDDAGTQKMAQSFMDEIHRLAVDDLEIWENKAYLATPCLADRDGPIMRFRKWASQFYVDTPA